MEGQTLRNLKYLIFGVFDSNLFGHYFLYKLTPDKLYVDKSEEWHNQRHTKAGYTFRGEPMTHDKFEIAKDVLKCCPTGLLDKSLKPFYTTGNKNEHKLVIEIAGDDFTKSITIDSYEIETQDLEKSLREFRLLIEETLKKLKE